MRDGPPSSQPVAGLDKGELDAILANGGATNDQLQALGQSALDALKGKGKGNSNTKGAKGNKGWRKGFGFRKGKGKGDGKCWECGEIGHRAADCPNKKGKGKGAVNELQDFVHSTLASAGIANPESEPQEGDPDCWECDEGFVDPNGQWHDWEEE